MKAKYKHTNLIAHDWQAPARFSGVHLLLTGYGDTGPTLEIYQYSKNEGNIVELQSWR